MEQSPTPFEALQRAVGALGSQTALADLCGVSQTAVWKWLQSSKRLPAEHVLKVEAATDISRHYLRPDIYPLELPAITAPPRFQGVDRGNTRVSFNTRGELKAAAR
jgi:DNA-binding transcriptional regulator YdaS (Cro superfamily)